MANIEDLKQEDIDKMEAALERYKKENKKFREERDEYKAQVEAGEVNVKLRDRAIKAEAKLKLAELGVTDVERFVKRIDYSTVGIDDQENITGLDEQIAGFQKDFPEVFDKKRRVGGLVDAAADNAPKTVNDPTQLQLKRLFKD